MRENSDSSSKIARAIIEILDRLSSDEKKHFARIFKWEEFEAIRKELNRVDGRKHGDPEVYVQASPEELNFELPVDKVKDFVRFLSEILHCDRVDVFIRKGKTSQENSYSMNEFRDFLARSEILLAEGYLMIEFGGNTLVSGGGGCMDLELEERNSELVKTIAEKVLEMCGFKHRFSKDRFYAIVWDKELEVSSHA